MAHRWTPSQAQAWYSRQPWLVGVNFTPSSAVNQLEMWQAETFDLQTIRRELGWAASLGFNTIRTYLHDLAWEVDPQGFKRRLDQFLSITAGFGIHPILVIFDDCWNNDPQPGPQPAPRPGVHNSGWVQSPGTRQVLDPAAWPRLESYVSDVLGTFARDERILLWDLYNEPGNNQLAEKSLPLLGMAFAWARAAATLQPLSVAVWSDNEALNDMILSESDVITFHNFDDVHSLEAQIQALKAFDRPLICSEYMARGRGSRFETHLPVFRREGIGCLSWGLVSGKTQTIYPWDSPPGAPEPQEWFHDIFRPDGSPFDMGEVEFIKKIIQGKNLTT